MESAISSLRNERKLFLEALTAARTIVSATLSHVLIRTRLTSSIFLCDLEHALSGAQTALNYPWDLDFANSELFKTSQCRSLRATFGWRAWPALLRSQTLKIHVYVLVRPFSPKLQRLFKDGFRLIFIYFPDLLTKKKYKYHLSAMLPGAQTSIEAGFWVNTKWRCSSGMFRLCFARKQ